MQWQEFVTFASCKCSVVLKLKHGLKFEAVESYGKFITSNAAVIIEVTEMKAIQGSTPSSLSLS